MKPLRIACFVAASLAFFGNVFGQGFENLDFEDANVSAYGSGPAFVPTTNAIPGWTAYISGVSETSILYNSVPLAAPMVCLLASNNQLSFPSIQGYYFIMLWGEFNAGQNGFYTNSAAIAQTGQIPNATKSITFWGTIGGMKVTFNGQPLTFITIGSIPNYSIYAADISAYAGQTGQLLFTGPYYGNTYGGPSAIDNIQFSPSPIPEPSALGLFSICILACWGSMKRQN